MQATFRFRGGASGTIAYLTGGNTRFPKETMDATGGGRSALLDNFKTATVWSGRGKATTKARGGQDKGQRAEMEQFVEAVRTGGPMPISVDSLLATTRATIAVGESLASGKPEAVLCPRLLPRSLAGMSAGLAGCRQARWPGGSGSRRSAGPGRASRCGRARWPRCLRRPLAGERRFTSVLPADAALGRPRGGQGRHRGGRGPDHGRRVGDARRRPRRHEGAGLVPRPGHGTALRPRGRTPSALTTGTRRAVGNVKQVWEVNRLQHLTLLATAWYLTGDDAYAERVDAQLRSWWAANPFLSGVNWTSGIELGVRLINFAWIRRLLDEWPGAADLFEGNDLALHQIRWHQQYLATFESRGSSANNHLIAEAAGQLAASCAFPWFAESARWRRQSAALLEKSLRDNTFPSGINRELASDYHGFVFELGVFAAAEAAAAGFPVSDDCWRLLCRDGRRHGRAGGRAAAAAPPGRLRRGPRGAARRPRAQPVAGPAVARGGALRPAGLVAGGDAGRGQRARPGSRGRATGRGWAARQRARHGSRRWNNHHPNGPGFRARDMVPLRRRAARVPVHRGARARRRAVR